MALRLHFDLAKTLRLAEHAVAADEHVASFTEHENHIRCPGALEWVHDDGVYLMSNGLPRLRAQSGANLTVHAEGWDPCVDDHRSDPDLGGDDFVEHLHLTEQPHPLITVLRAAHAAGLGWLELTVSEDTFEVRVTHTRHRD
ncbi:DUF3085 domain-containing protein [Micromonospora sp. HM134]|uniref:DUF3085 domain-containing protein n=1 Tax=Micromonospora sp. HM134 TaxID=2583243 RepID=UPI00143D11CC|nr:DUF3085 domain-containing protein [Micromonospora sp. HM134]